MYEFFLINSFVNKLKKNFYIAILFSSAVFNDIVSSQTGLVMYPSFESFYSELVVRPVLQDILGEEECYRSENEEFHNVTLKTYPQINDKELFYYNSIINNYEPLVLYDDFQQLLKKSKEKIFLSNKDFFEGQKKTNRNGTVYSFFKKGQMFSVDEYIHVIGDQHGAGHDTVYFLNYVFTSDSGESPFEKNSWKIKDSFKKQHWVFAGDLTDSGAYSLETLYLVLRAQLENPENIHVLRGNHEDYALNKEYGFEKELKLKFPDKDLRTRRELGKLLHAVYNMLPVALFAGFKHGSFYNWLLIAHAGFDNTDTNFTDFWQKTVRNGVAYSDVNSSEEYNYTATLYQWNRCSKKEDGSINKDAVIEELQFLNENSTKQHRWSFIISGHQQALSVEGLTTDILINGGMAFLPDNEKPKEVVLSAATTSVYGIPKKVCCRTAKHTKEECKKISYPGTLELVISVLTHNYIYFVQLPNVHIPEITMQQHEDLWKENSVLVGHCPNQYVNSSTVIKKILTPVNNDYVQKSNRYMKYCISVPFFLFITFFFYKQYLLRINYPMSRYSFFILKVG